MFGWFKRKSGPPEGPDFSGVDSQEKVLELFRQGHLEKLLLMPAVLGGEDGPSNTLYVPVGTVAVKSGIDDNIIAPLVAEGKVTKYEASAEYQGKSFIPIAIEIKAFDPGDFTTVINIWGEALGR